MYQALGNIHIPGWIQAWSHSQFAGWFWSAPKDLVSALGASGCNFSIWYQGNKLIGGVHETNVPYPTWFGIPPNYAGWEWFEVWEAPNSAGGVTTPKWLGWLFTKPLKGGGSGALAAFVGTFKCSPLILIRYSTRQRV